MQNYLGWSETEKTTSFSLLENRLFVWFLYNNPDNFYKNFYIFSYFLATFSPHSDLKFGPDIPKMVMFLHEPYILEIYGQAFVVYFLPYSLPKLLKTFTSVIFYIFCQFFNRRYFKNHW